METGTEPEEGETLYGVFLQACNRSEEAHEAVEEFRIVDNQGNEFEPEELPEENHFAYHPRELLPNECIPESGSVAHSARRPARCCCSGCRSRTPSTARWSSRSRARATSISPSSWTSRPG